MKISVKLLDHQQSRRQNHHHPPLLLRAKIPVTIFNLPFLSHFSTTTTHPSDLSLSLSTNFPSFPSLKLSYAAAAAAASTPPLSLTLKSGTGLFGSPNNSPLVISAHFSFNPCNPSNPNPTFSLFFKPQLGSFSLRKSTFSHPESGVIGESNAAGCDQSSFGFVPLERPANMKENNSNDKDSILKGIRLAAATQMPVSKGVALNFRWWVNFAEDQMPVLRINKIGLHRIDDVVLNDETKKKEKNEAKLGQVEALKGMCFGMKRELDVLTRVNREMKSELDEMRAAHLGGSGVGFRGGDTKEKEKEKEKVKVKAKAMPQWRIEENSNSNGNGKREVKKKDNLVSDVENELQRAIMAAAVASSSP